MLIAYDTPGQLGNQLWAYTNLIAVGKEYGHAVTIILQDNYYRLLDEKALQSAAKQKIKIYPAGSKKAGLIRRAVLFFTVNNKKAIRNFAKKIFNVAVITGRSDANDKAVRSDTAKTFLINSWENRGQVLAFTRQSDLVRSLIYPEQGSRQKAEYRIEKLRQKFDRLVAVHIRRGDYLHFREGRYYFENGFYKSRMEEIAGLSRNQNIVFVIFSNENIDLKDFEGLNVSFDNSNTAIADMWAMGLCDFITGPLSTFSMWASFWRKIPLLFLEKDTVITNMDMFSIVIAQDVQANDALLPSEKVC